MKKRNNSAADGPKLNGDALKGGVGNKGLATAPIDRSQNRGFAKKLGLGPVSGSESTKTNIVRRAAVSDMEVTILHGDDGNLFYRFAVPSREILVPSKEVVDGNNKVISDLTGIGILATSKEDKAAVVERIHAAKEDPTSTVATHLGFERNTPPRYFVFGDGSVIAPVLDPKISPYIASTDKFQKSGGLRIYEKKIAKVVRNQAVPIAVFFYGL